MTTSSLALTISCCCFFLICVTSVTASRLPSSSSSSSSSSSPSSDASGLSSLEGKFPGNSLPTDMDFGRNVVPFYMPSDGSSPSSSSLSSALTSNAALNSLIEQLSQEYEEARAYDQLMNMLQDYQTLVRMTGGTASEGGEAPIRLVQRSRPMFPEDFSTSGSNSRFHANRRFPPPPAVHSLSSSLSSRLPTSRLSKSQGNGNNFKSQMMTTSNTDSGHEQQKRPESPQRLIAGPGVSGLASFLTQSYGLGKDGSIGVRFGLS